jgi:hypothetical protein
MPSERDAGVERHLTYLTLTGLFTSLMALFSLRQRRRGEHTSLSPFELLQLALAAYRLGRLVSYDKVFETERLAVAVTVPDPTGAGETTMPRGSGARQALGELVCCPICAGTWISAFLLYGHRLFPEFTRNVVTIMSAMGAAELINAVTEGMQWTGEAMRKQAGRRGEDEDFRD